MVNSFKKIIYSLLPDWFKISYYKTTGSRPWSRGYLTFKFKYIEKVINNYEIMGKFKNFQQLPQGYGYALDERVVEYSWLLSRFPREKGKKLLDAGSTLNFKAILDFPSLKNKNITIVNLNPEDNCFWTESISYVFGDIRNLPFKENYFDYITCISTLEHIGMDNVMYTKDLRDKKEKIFDFEKGILEMKRVLKSRGKLFITVPFGKYKNYGRFQQFDSKMVKRILEVFEPKSSYTSYYKYTKEGWDISNEKECENSEHWILENSAKPAPDSAAASRAVACLELVKQ